MIYQSVSEILLYEICHTLWSCVDSYLRRPESFPINFYQPLYISTLGYAKWFVSMRRAKRLNETNNPPPFEIT